MSNNPNVKNQYKNTTTEITNLDNKILPCPFCKTTVRLTVCNHITEKILDHDIINETSYDTVSINCPNCQFQSTTYFFNNMVPENKESVIQQLIHEWNTRNPNLIDKFKRKRHKKISSATILPNSCPICGNVSRLLKINTWGFFEYQIECKHCWCTVYGGSIRKSTLQKEEENSLIQKLLDRWKNRT